MKKSQRQIQKFNTRKHLIDVAIEQFAKNGLVATSTTEIAKEAKVSHGTVFAHFATREILLEEVIEEFGNRITNRLHELVDKNCTMKDVLHAHLKGIQEFEAFYTRLTSESSLLSENARSSLIMIQSAISFHICEIAEREIKAEKIREMPVNLLFNTWIGLIHYYLVNGDLFAPGGKVLKRYSQQLVDHYFRLLEKGEV